MVVISLLPVKANLGGRNPLFVAFISKAASLFGFVVPIPTLPAEVTTKSFFCCVAEGISAIGLSFPPSI